MKTYIVGGAVRDILLNKQSKDTDIVVVGATPQVMLDMGFTQHGKDFPVFLHPVTKDEFALARTERKTGAGSAGFDCEWGGVTLEEDLSRRDLTINAMAFPLGDLETTDFTKIDSVLLAKWNPAIIIDPFNGQSDLAIKSLRHVSPAFAEDPLRVLRVARFQARFGYEWSIHQTTKHMIRNIFDSGELEHLTAERVWLETKKALMEDHPQLYFETLEGLNIFNEVDALRGVPQPAAHHPEVDTFVHIMLCLQYAAKTNLSLEERFAVLCHDLGKRVTYDARKNLYGHEAAGVPLVKTLCKRLKVPGECAELAKIMCEHHTRIHRCSEAKATSIMNLFTFVDAVRRPQRFEKFLKCCEVDAKGRLGYENTNYPAADFMRVRFKVVAEVDTMAISSLVETRFANRCKAKLKKKTTLGQLIGEEIREERVRAIKRIDGKVKK